MTVTPSSGGWIFDEDNALKTLLQGITVTDQANNARQLLVRFNQPEVEVGKQQYPFALIHLIDVTESTERAMRNRVDLTYVPDGAPAPVSGQSYTTDYPIPYSLFYQVTTYARNARHDRQIIRAMMDRFGGRMHTLYVPEDDTQRSMFLRGSQKRDFPDSGNRITFSNVYTIEVFTELLPTDIVAQPQVSTVTQKVDFTVDKLVIPTS